MNIDSNIINLQYCKNSINGLIKQNNYIADDIGNSFYKYDNNTNTISRSEIYGKKESENEYV